MAEIEVKLDSAKAKRFLENLVKNVNEVDKSKRLAVEMSPIIFRDIMDHFSKESGPKGKWVEWSDGYKKRMNKIGRGGNKKLQFNGRLRQSFQAGNHRVSSEGYEWFNPATLKGGFPYAKAHDEGMGKRPPQREFMWLSDQGLSKVSSIMMAFILKD